MLLNRARVDSSGKIFGYSTGDPYAFPLYHACGVKRREREREERDNTICSEKAKWYKREND